MPEAVAEVANKLDRNTIIKLAITFGIPLIIMLIPTNDVFTGQMRTAIAATAGLLIWSACELTDLAVPSILWSAILVFSGTCEAKTVFAPYLSITFSGAMSMMIFAMVMARVGVLKRLAFWIAGKSGGTFDKLVLGTFLACFGIAVGTFTGGVIIAAAFVFGICKALDLIGTEKGAILTMAGIMGIGSVRMFWNYPVTISAMQGAVQAGGHPEFILDFVTLFQYNWPCFFFCIIALYVMMILSKTRKDPIMGGKEYFDNELKAMGKMSRDEKLSIIFLIALLIWVVTAPITGFEMMYGFCFFSLALFIPGVSVGKKEDFQGFPIGTLLFVLACMSIGGVCTATGIVAVIKGFLTPMLSSLDPGFAVFGVLLSGVIGNIAMTPMALLAGFSSMLYELFLSIGINPLAALFSLNMGCDLVFLPYEYTTPLLFMAFGTMSVGQFFKWNVVKNIVFFIFFAAIMIPFWNLTGLL